MSTVADAEVDDELLVLSSIYGDDFSLVKGPWGLKSFVVTLESVSCTFVLDKTYPRKGPDVTIVSKYVGIEGIPNSSVHMSERDLQELRKIVRAQAEELVGEIMLHELASTIENYVKEHQVSGVF